MLTTILSFVILLFVLIFVHELGHFLAAKALGVKVEKFSLGFPPKIWSKKIGETEYQMGWVILGGYVKMLGEEPDSDEKIPAELEKRSFAHQPPWAKIIIVLAGPLFNLIFAALLFWAIIAFSGIPHLAPLIGPVAPNSPAALAGVMMDDLIVAVNGNPSKYFDELDSALNESAGAPVKLTVNRGGLEKTFEIVPDKIDAKDLFGQPIVRYEAGISHRTKPIIERLSAGKAAAKSELQPGDLIVAIDGRPTLDWEDVLEGIQGPEEMRYTTSPKAVRPLSFEVMRAGQRKMIQLTPELVTGLNADGDITYNPIVGIEVRSSIVIEKIGFLNAAVLGFKEAKSMIGLTLRTVKMLLTRQISAKTLGGPILIAEVTGDRARAGLVPLLNLAAFISINLGILNLLPVPMLDGGQLVFFLIEAIRRKPLSLRFREALQWVGFVCLGFLMILVFYNDIGRLITRLSTKTEVVAPVQADQEERINHLLPETDLSSPADENISENLPENNERQITPLGENI